MSMNIEEAIKRIQNHIIVHRIYAYPHVYIGEALGMAIDALRQQEKYRWIPVTERLPDRNNPVLVRCTNTTISGGYVIHIGSCDSGKFWFLRTQPGTASFPVMEWQVTHWMPLPDPPKEVAP